MSLVQRLWRWLSPPPTDDFWYRPTGQQTAAGIHVDDSVAMTYSACWAATRLLSTSGSMIPLKLFRKLPEGGSEPATDLRRYYLVHDQFNQDMSPMMFRSSRIAQQINRGNCFGEIEFSRGGQAVAIHPIHPHRIPRENIKRDGAGIYYLVNNDDGTKTALRSWEVFHVPSPISDDGIWGLGVVENARLTIGFGIATELQGAGYMGNSGRPSYSIEGGKFKDKADREDYRRQWAEVHGGPANNGKPAFLPPESKLHVHTWSAEDSQFLETRQHNVEEVARWYGVPPHLIGHLLRSTYNNIEHQSLEFVKYSLMPWLVLWEQELNRKLLSPEERRTLFFRHVVDGLERGDLTTRTQALKEQFFNGKITLNEWRALDDQNPIGPDGDLHFVQQAMIPLEIAAKGPQQPAAAPESDDEPEAEPPTMDEPDDEPLSPQTWQDEVREIRKAKGLPSVDVDEHYWGNPPDRDENGKYIVERLGVAARVSRLESRNDEQLSAALIEVVEQVVTGMLEREAKHAMEASRKPNAFLQWLDGFYDDHTERLRVALTKPVRACLLATGRVDSVDDVVKRAVELHVAAGREALLNAAGVHPDKFPQAIESCVSTWDRGHIISYLGANSNGKH